MSAGVQARHRLLAYAFTLAVVTYLDRICISAAAIYTVGALMWLAIDPERELAS